MPQEIERKFLIKERFLKEGSSGGPGLKEILHQAIRSFPITQGYLSTAPGRTVRIRIQGDKAILAIKGSRDATGIRRFEWEKEISVEEAAELLLLCEPGIIKKERYVIPFKSHLFEVDVFSGENEGLLVGMHSSNYIFFRILNPA